MVETMKTIALIEDEPNLAANYKNLFEREGYRVIHYSNRTSAEKGMMHQLPDLAIVDVGLEDEADGGFTLVQWLRSKSETLPIVFLTHRDGDIDVISGIRLGADEYLTKDIGLMQLSVRVSALLRRYEIIQGSAEGDSSKNITVDDLALDLDCLKASWKEQDIPLTVTEFWLVNSIASHPGHVKTRQQLMDAANVVLDDATITSHVKRIRRKFNQIDPDFKRIETVYSQGYRWKKG